MPAAQKIKTDIKKLGILAGGGEMPLLAARAARALGIEVFVIAFEGQNQIPALADYPHDEVPLARVGRTMDILKAQGISDLIFVGSIVKPALADLRPDWTTAKLLMKHGYSALGDDGLLTTLRGFLEGQGFVLHGVHMFLPELLTPAGQIGAVGYHACEVDIALGVEEARAWGLADKGQSVLVHNDEIIAREARAGTDAMIKAHGCPGAVLVKMCKPQQDRDLDLPTIGLRTVQNAVDIGLVGIAAHAGASLFLNQDEAIALADAHGIFVAGVSGDF